MMFYRSLVLLTLLAMSCNYHHEKETPSPFPIEFASENISFTTIKEGILRTKCLGCHSAGHSAQRIPLETREDLIDSPLELVIPGNPDDSGLMIAVTRTDNKRMPPPPSGISPLTAQEINIIRQWILEGADK